MAKKRTTKKAVSRKGGISRTRKSAKQESGHRFGVIKIPRDAKVTWGDQWSVLNITDTGYESD